MPSPSSARPSTGKRMFWMLLAVAIVFGGIFFVKWFGNRAMNQFLDNMPQPPATISAAEAVRETWSEAVQAVGTLEAVNGANVTTEAGGVVSAIHFEAGQEVAAGDVLLHLNASTEIATLRALEASAELARTQAERYRELGERQLVSRAEIDQRASEAASTLAQAEAQRALIAQKTIRAPFSGVLGIRRVNLGQYIGPGDAIVSLQSLDPIFLNFTLPQQRLAEVRTGQRVVASVDAQDGRSFEGEITAIEPEVDPDTRNFMVQATLRNPDRSLRPGTFARVSFDLGEPTEVVVIPQTAISFNPYGNSVYVITEAAPEDGEAAGQAPTLVVNQRFVRTGATRGDFIAVLEGLQPGERVASSGLLKLRNGAAVVIGEDAPEAQARPEVDNR
ncbi:efflux RND transporter periplasmic adaptor subunit [Coralloluteibacterium thermophilus]|uniref:Efflux RND transporter periplasmic adaptor subunit n=1 Tax=Coralloluteibacterium thermophilum TaxID=2707049 RepID=A0ABV9NKV9_9GAMM